MTQESQPDSPPESSQPVEVDESPHWFGASDRPANLASDTAPASPSREVKKVVRELTDDVVRDGSHVVHWLLASRDPAQRAAGVWKATDEQVKRIAEPASALIVGAIPEALLRSAVVHGLRLLLGVAHYTTDHLALRDSVTPGRGRHISFPVPDVAAEMQQ